MTPQAHYALRQMSLAMTFWTSIVTAPLLLWSEGFLMAGTPFYPDFFGNAANYVGYVIVAVAVPPIWWAILLYRGYGRAVPYLALSNFLIGTLSFYIVDLFIHPVMGISQWEAATAGSMVGSAFAIAFDVDVSKALRYAFLLTLAGALAMLVAYSGFGVAHVSWQTHLMALGLATTSSLAITLKTSRPLR